MFLQLLFLLIAESGRSYHSLYAEHRPKQPWRITLLPWPVIAIIYQGWDEGKEIGLKTTLMAKKNKKGNNVVSRTAKSKIPVERVAFQIIAKDIRVIALILFFHCCMDMYIYIYVYIYIYMCVYTYIYIYAQLQRKLYM